MFVGSGFPTPTGGDLSGAWEQIQAALRKSIRREQFETWFRRAGLRSFGPEGVHIVVQNGFAADWLRSNYMNALEQATRAVFGQGWPIVIDIDPELSAQARPRSPDEPAAPMPVAAPATNGVHQRAPREPRGNAPESGLLWSSDVALNPHYRFDNFVVGPCNRFAYAAAVGVSESPGKSYNPFFLHGSVGLGKTHLLQSLCYSLLERDPQTRILYLSCETFINHFISALENGDLQKFRNKYRNVDVLVVDDIHLLANKERTQEEFFHTFNTLYNASKQIVLSSDSPPKEIPTLQDRLVSRFKWGLVTEIEKPCYETRMAILKRKSRERGKELPDSVAQLVAEHIDSNIRELEGAVNRLLGYASLNNLDVTPDLARHVLRDIFVSPKGQPSMDDVLRLITSHFQLKVTELQSRRRTKAIAHPRQIGMYLARTITRHSLEEIGGFFGGRDHTTVLYAVEQIEKQMKSDDRFRASVQGLLSQLRR
ncbi:MAG: chromosomal replication initiator protein DnaA [Planctomycetota bacterium]|nr:chromosomal replication initiator protein DnaA [Planctomycetota bacterium]